MSPQLQPPVLETIKVRPSGGGFVSAPAHVIDTFY